MREAGKARVEIRPFAEADAVAVDALLKTAPASERSDDFAAMVSG